MAWKDELPTPGLKPWHEQMGDAADAWESDVASKVSGKQDAADLDADVAANVANGASATGSAVIAQAQAVADAKIAASRPILYGSGIPEGSVTAPVGTKYIDLDKTSGAREWLKDTGAGNAGWIVTVGDTGWRRIRSWTSDGIVTGPAFADNWIPRPGVSGYCDFRRVNGRVYFRATGFGTSGQLAGGASLVSPPTGFAAPSITSANTVVQWYSSANAIKTFFMTAALTRASNIGTAAGDYATTATLDWETTQAWPATLPGTPA